MAPGNGRTIPPLPLTERGFPCNNICSLEGTLIYGSGTCVSLYPAGESAVVVNHHASKVTAVAISPNGLWIATGDAKGLVKLWPSRGERMQKYEYRPIASAVRGICWSPDSRKLAIVGGESGRGAEGCCISYDTGSAVGQSFSGHSKPITSVAFRPVAPFRIITGSEDTSVVFHEGPPFKFMKSCQTAHTNFVNAVAFSMDGSKAFSCSSDGAVAVYSGDAGELLSVLDPKLQCSILGIAVGANNRLFAACGDRKLRTIATDSLSILHEYQSPTNDMPLGITVDAKKNTVSAVYLGGSIHQFTVGKNSELVPSSSFHGSCGAITSIVHYKDSLLVTALEGSAWTLPQPFLTSSPILFPVKKLFKPTAGVLVDLVEVMGVSATSDELINLKTGDVKKYPIPALASRLFACRPVGFALGDRGSKIARVHQPGKLFELDHPAGVFAVSLDGETTVFAPSSDSSKSSFQQVEREIVVNMKHRIRTTITTADIVNLAVNPDGSMIAVASGAQELHVFKKIGFDKFELIPETAKVWTYHKARITAMCWSDKKTLVTGGLDKTVYVWDVEKPMSGPISSMRDQHKEGVSALLAFRAENGAMVVVSGGNEGSVRVTEL